MNFSAKVEALKSANASMNSSKELCIEDAIKLEGEGKIEAANARLEKAAQYAWGFNRPGNW